MMGHWEPSKLSASTPHRVSVTTLFDLSTNWMSRLEIYGTESETEKGFKKKRETTYTVGIQFISFRQSGVFKIC